MVRATLAIVTLLLLPALAPLAPATGGPADPCAEVEVCSIATYYADLDGAARLEDPPRAAPTSFFERSDPGSPFVTRISVPPGGLRLPEDGVVRVVLADRTPLATGTFNTTIRVVFEPPFALPLPVGEASFEAVQGYGGIGPVAPLVDQLAKSLEAVDDASAREVLTLAIQAMCDPGPVRSLFPSQSYEACGAIHADPGIGPQRPCRGPGPFPPGSVGYEVTKLVHEEARETRPCNVSARDDANATADLVDEQSPGDGFADALDDAWSALDVPPPPAERWTTFHVPLDAHAGVPREGGALVLPSGTTLRIEVATRHQPFASVSPGDALADAVHEAGEEIPDDPPAEAEPAYDAIADACAPRPCPVGQVVQSLWNGSKETIASFEEGARQFGGPSSSLAPVAFFRYASHETPTRVELPLAAPQSPLPADAMPIRPGTHHGQLLLRSGSPNPTDTYAFLVNAGDAIRVEGNALFEVRDAQGREAAASQATIAIPQPAPGEWMLRVHHAQGAAGEYAFRLTVAPPAAPIAHDDAGSGRDASWSAPVEVGHGTHTGRLSAQDTEDGYVVRAEREQAFDLALSHGPAAHYALYVDGQRVSDAAHIVSPDARSFRVDVRRLAGEGPYTLGVAMGPYMDRTLIPEPAPMFLSPGNVVAHGDGALVQANGGLVRVVGTTMTLVDADWRGMLFDSDAAGRLYLYANGTVLARMDTPAAAPVDIVRGGGEARVGADGALYAWQFPSPQGGAWYARITPSGSQLLTRFEGTFLGLPIPAPDGSHLMIAGARVLRLDALAGNPTVAYEGSSMLTGLDVADDGTLYVTATNDTLLLVDPVTAEATVIAVGAEIKQPVVARDHVYVKYSSPTGPRLGAVAVPGAAPFLGPATFEPPARPDLVVAAVREETVESPVANDVAETRRIIVTIRNAGDGAAVGRTVVTVRGDPPVLCYQTGSPRCLDWSREVVVDLAPGALTDVAFDWDTTGQVGHHALSANVGIGRFSPYLSDVLESDERPSAMTYETHVLLAARPA